MKAAGRERLWGAADGLMEQETDFSDGWELFQVEKGREGVFRKRATVWETRGA